jgi:hypothetical protein
MLKRLLVVAAAIATITPVFAQPQGTPPGGRNTVEMRRRDGGDYHEYLYDSRGVITPYPLNEQRLPARFYRSGYRLTPREYARWRAAGFTQQEVYMIANAARVSGLDPGVFAAAIYRGLYARQISYQYNLNERSLTRILPEWRTPAWAAATGDPAITRDRLNVWW